MKTTSRKPDSVSIVNITPADAKVAANHLLHARRQRYVGMREAFMDAVGDRAIVVQRGKHMLDAIQNRIDAARR